MNGGNNFQGHHRIGKKSAQQLAACQRAAMACKTCDEKGGVVLRFSNNKAQIVIRQRRRKMICGVHVDKGRYVHLFFADMRQAGFIAARTDGNNINMVNLLGIIYHSQQTDFSLFKTFLIFLPEKFIMQRKFYFLHKMH